MNSRLRRAITFGVLFVVALVAALVVLVWGGPFFSGAIYLTRSTGNAPAPHDLVSYRPRHKGHVDVSTGLYVREDEDLILDRTPPFRFTRTYLSKDRVSRQFGIGATNNAEWYLIGDPARFQWAELILADGGRIHFDRISPGTSYANAMFRHRATPTRFFGALLGWTGLRWVMRFYDGGFAAFQSCSPGGNDVCSLIETRDDDGHRLRFRRDGSGRVVSIEGPSQRLTLVYDGRKRIASAEVAGGIRVEYTYDSAGRLIRTRSSDHVTREYAYGPHDEMLTIREPGWLIENTYDDAVRVVRQVTHFDASPDDPKPEAAVIAFSYTEANGAVVATDVTEYDGTHTEYKFNARHYAELEVHDATSPSPVLLSIDRDPNGQFVNELTVRCTVDGRRVTRSVAVRGGGISEEEARDQLLTEACPRGGRATHP
jgi:YD repeat-containing protein